jgi:uncharacterized protein
VVVALAVVAIYASVSWVFSGKLIAQQFAAKEDVAFSDFGLPAPENETIDNGTTHLAAWYFPNPQAAHCAVVLLHGFTSNRAEVLIAAPLFWGRGCDLLAFDLRGHGDSSRGLLTYGVLDKRDELAAVDWLSRRTGLKDGRIGLMGWSYGAATSLQAAAARPDLAFVVADSSFSSLSDIASVQAGKLFGSWAKMFVPGALLISGWRAGFDTAQAAPERAVRGLRTPVLLVHSTTDDFTPYQQSESIYANSDHRHTRLVLTRWGAPHSMSYPTDPAAYTRLVDSFLDTYVPRFGFRQTP